MSSLGGGTVVLYAGCKVDYPTALSLDDNRPTGTDTFIKMYNGGDPGSGRRGWLLQLDDSGEAGFGSNNPWVVRRDIEAGKALVHRISEILLPQQGPDSAFVW